MKKRLKRLFGGVDGAALPIDLDRVPTVHEAAGERAPHNPVQTLMPEGMTANELVAAAQSMPALVVAVGTIAKRFEQFVGNVDLLNRTLGEFKRDVLQPLREELHHIRYNTGDRLTQTCNDIDAYVGKLDQVLWGALRAQGLSDDQIRTFRTEHGMSPETPRGPELALHLAKVEELRRSNQILVDQNRRLMAQLDTRHTFAQGENGWVWHQSCPCLQCVNETQRISAAQAEVLRA